jgi:hypothetical protein
MFSRAGNFSDNGRARSAAPFEKSDHLGQAPRRHGKQQAATGLRVAQQNSMNLIGAIPIDRAPR